MKRPRFWSNIGQTSVEYVMIMAVSVGLGITFFKKLDAALVSDPNSIIGNKLNSFKTLLAQDPKYKRFIIPR